MGFGKAVVVAVVAALVAYVVMFMKFVNIGQVTWSHQPGPCHLVKGIEYGSEDFEILPDNTALITSGLRFIEKIDRLRPHVKGQVFLFDFERPQNDVVPVQIKSDSLDFNKFNPLGIDSYVNKDGVTLVYIINISFDEQARVEKFKWNPSEKTLTHLRSILDPSFRVTNNLVLTGEGEDMFYVTNVFHSDTEFGRQMEILSFREWGSVVYYNGQKGEVVADGIRGANGIAMSGDGKYVYVAKALGRELLVYRRQQNNSLVIRNTIPVNTTPDNIQVEPGTGHLWLGCHPVVWRMLQHSDDGVSPAPSQVLRLKMDGEHVLEMEEIFSDSGRYIFASSVAAYRKGGVLIGTVMHKAMYCEVKYLTPN